MSSIDASQQMTPQTAQHVLDAFAHTFRLTGSRLIDRHGNVPSDRTLQLVVQAQAVLA